MLHVPSNVLLGVRIIDSSHLCKGLKTSGRRVECSEGWQWGWVGKPVTAEIIIDKDHRLISSRGTKDRELRGNPFEGSEGWQWVLDRLSRLRLAIALVRR